MIQIWQKCASFQTRRILAYQVRKIKKGWFSDLETLEIHQKTNNELDSHTISDTSIDKQEQSNRNELLTSENRNTTRLNNTLPNNTEPNTKTRTKISLENLKRIMNGKKTTLSSLRNIELRKVKMELKK